MKKIAGWDSPITGRANSRGSLTATGSSWLERLWIYGDVDAGALRFRVEAVCDGKAPDWVRLAVSVKSMGGTAVAERVVKLEAGKEKRLTLPIESPRLWSPDEPNLYQVDAVLLSDEDVLDVVSEWTGFIKLSIKGKQFLINGAHAVGGHRQMSAGKREERDRA